MHSIAVSILALLIIGIPQCMLAVLALHIFTRTKINLKKYILLSLIYAIAAYLIRFLPIAIGVNTVLSFFIMILTFQFAYKTQLSMVIRITASASVVFILIAISEVFNMLLLTIIFNQQKAVALLNSSDKLIQSISTIPSNIFFLIFIFIGYFVVKKAEKREQSNGKTGTNSGK